jgi:hypothetical protein
MYVSYQDYQKALTMGQREFRTCQSLGQSPYPQVLDETLAGVDVQSEVALGLVNIPIDQIIGTRSAGRTQALSRSFFPLMDSDTEFAAKWVSLCDSHLEEGIRDPIKAYEYMHNFYVVEGHKRVSVMRYFGAVTIPGVVKRVVPVLTDHRSTRIYYEFMDFYQLTGINYLWFHKTGRFALLQALVGKAPGEGWSREERLDFFSFYLRFSQAFAARAQRRHPNLPVGDAMLAAIDFYGYPQLKDCLTPDLTRKLQQIRETLAVAAHEHHISTFRWLIRWFPRPRRLVLRSLRARFRFRRSIYKGSEISRMRAP